MGSEFPSRVYEPGSEHPVSITVPRSETLRPFTWTGAFLRGVPLSFEDIRTKPTAMQGCFLLKRAVRKEMITRRAVLGGLATVPLAACGAAPEKRAFATPDEVARLETQILAMRDDVDPDEAARAADIAFQHTRELAIQYQITDPPLVHNTKVNIGLRPRGLCWHWAEDMEKRLDAEGFSTLEMNRAIAEGRGVRIDHSTAIISAKGDGYSKGVVLDPWRNGGVLFFAPLVEDTRYSWEAREVVLGRRADLAAVAG